jgi:DNA-directed RNA polymerase specialized sigma24 family protein
MRLLPALLGLALLASGLAGCGGSRALARVGDRSISRSDVELLLEHADEEARTERRSFPAADSDAYRALEREALAILVSRAQLEVAARRIGISVSAQEVSHALGRAAPRHKEAIELVYEHARKSLGIAEADAGSEGAALADATRAQLTLRKLVDRLGRDGVQPWLANARRTVPAVYADGWSPAQ